MVFNVFIPVFKGYEILLSTCKDFTILSEMLILVDFYDIPRHVLFNLNQLIGQGSLFLDLNSKMKQGDQLT